MIAKTNTQHYQNIADEIRAANDYAVFKSEIEVDNELFEDIGEAIAEKDNGEVPKRSELVERIGRLSNSLLIFEQIVNRTATGTIISDKVSHLLPAMFDEMGTITGVILNRNPLFIGGYPVGRTPSQCFNDCTALKYVILPHLANELPNASNRNSLGNYVFNRCNNLKLIILNTMGRSPEGSMFSGANNIINLIISNNVIIPLTNTNTFVNSAISNGTCNIYIPDILKESYKAATNWSTYASQFKGYSEAPDYDTSIIYTIGDVCKYNNKLYAWINETDSNSKPIGNIDEYNDWYCVANIEEVEI